MTGPEASALLCEVSAIGAYFEVAAEAAGSDWVHFDRLLDADIQRERVRQVISTVATRSGRSAVDIDERAAASIHFMAIASRLLAPAVAAVAIRGEVVNPDPARVWWQPVDDGPIPFAWTAFDSTPATSPGDAAELVEAGILGRLVGPLAAGFGQTFRISDQVLLGNMASALNGAAILLRGRPMIYDPTDVVAALISTGRLAGTGAYHRNRRFARNNCCLYYRIPGAAMCGDCVLRR